MDTLAFLLFATLSNALPFVVLQRAVGKGFWFLWLKCIVMCNMLFSCHDVVVFWQSMHDLSHDSCVHPELLEKHAYIGALTVESAWPS